MPEYILQPLPDDGDDLISHYASPKRIYDLLPLDLFPRPDPETERFQSSIFPCYRYYDASKYSEEDARKLSAMDLIPKDVLKKADENQHRAKRLKRSTTESANVAGYYRFKNEGVEVFYSGRDNNGQSSKGVKTRRAQMANQNLKETHEVSAVFSSILKAPNSKATPVFRNEKPVPKKQGNRLEFLAGLRQNMLKPNGKSKTIPALSSPAKRPTIRSRKQIETEECEEDDSKSVGSLSSHATESSEEDEFVENGTVGPVWNEEEFNSSGNKDISIEVMAHEELGASDDEDLLGFPNFMAS